VHQLRNHRPMRLKAPCLVVLGFVGVFGVGMVSTADVGRTATLGSATPNIASAYCTAAQKAQRVAALAAYRKQMLLDRRAYFATHKSVQLRRAFVQRQGDHLQALVVAAACTVTATSHSGRLAQLGAYARQMQALTPLFDPAVTSDDEDVLAQITDDEQTCDLDPTDGDCPVPASAYQATATSLRDASAAYKRLAAKVAAFAALPMSLTDYNAATVSAAEDCGIDLETLATSHKRILSSASRWESLLGSWAATYATGKSVDWDTVDEYVPGGGSFGDDARDALAVWAVMVNGYWNSLLASHDIVSRPPVPEWISDFNDGECPAPD
jgi:hypothetical protein